MNRSNPMQTFPPPRRSLAAFVSAGCLVALLCGGCAGYWKLATESKRTGGLWSVLVTSPAFKAGERIPERFTRDGRNVSPPLHWSDPPADAQSAVVIVEDPDVKARDPFVHWIVYNIPADVTSLPEGVFTRSKAVRPAGAIQGLNSLGDIGYTGPQPPYDGRAHHYHFQVFYLDHKLDLQPGADKSDVIHAMRGNIHVLSKGDLVATYER